MSVCGEFSIVKASFVLKLDFIFERVKNCLKENNIPLLLFIDSHSTKKWKNLSGKLQFETERVVPPGGNLAPHSNTLLSRLLAEGPNYSKTATDFKKGVFQFWVLKIQISNVNFSQFLFCSLNLKDQPDARANDIRTIHILIHIRK